MMGTVYTLWWVVSIWSQRSVTFFLIDCSDHMETSLQRASKARARLVSNLLLFREFFFKRENAQSLFQSFQLLADEKKRCKHSGKQFFKVTRKTVLFKAATVPRKTLGCILQTSKMLLDCRTGWLAGQTVKRDTPAQSATTSTKRECIALRGLPH